MCINYANERLQCYFNDAMLASEQAEYAAEGLDWARVPFLDNLALTQLLDCRSTGAPAPPPRPSPRTNRTRRVPSSSEAIAPPRPSERLRPLPPHSSPCQYPPPVTPSAPVGLFRTLDDQSLLATASDESFLEVLGQRLASSPLFSRPRLAHSAFVIVHSSGPVEYEAAGFLDKNRDQCHPPPPPPSAPCPAPRAPRPARRSR